MYDENDIPSIIKTQAMVRGFLARKAYQIKPLPKAALKDYPVLITGNDPCIKRLPRHNADETVALVGTSGMRSIEIACRLSNGHVKLIIIDNSRQVTSFWRAAREIMMLSNTEDQFLKELNTYLKISHCSRNSCLTKEESHYLKALIDYFGLGKIKQIMTSAVVLGQSWGDTAVIIKVKNVLAHLEIQYTYAYVSNIVSYLACRNENAEAQKVLENIQRLEPYIAIHTDLIPKKQCPENLFLIQDHDPAKVKRQLKPRESPSLTEGMYLLVLALSSALLLSQMEAPQTTLWLSFLTVRMAIEVRNYRAPTFFKQEALNNNKVMEDRANYAPKF